MKTFTLLALPFAIACQTSVASTPTTAPQEDKGKPPAMKGTLVVVNKNANNVSLINLQTGELKKTVPVGFGPHEAAISPNGKLIAVTNYGGPGNFPGSSLTIIELPSGDVVKTVSTGDYKAPHGIEWVDNERVVHTSEVSQSLSLLNVMTEKVERVFSTKSPGSHMLVLSSDRKRVYSANIGSANVSGFDFQTGELIGTADAGPVSEGIGLTPDGKYVWTSNRKGPSVSIIDAEKMQKLKDIPMKGDPYRISCSPDGKWAVMASPPTGELALFDAKKLEYVKTIDVAAGTRKFGILQPAVAGLCFHPDGKYLLSTVLNSAAVAVVDLDKQEVVGRFKVGQGPDGIAVSPIEMP